MRLARRFWRVVLLVVMVGTSTSGRAQTTRTTIDETDQVDSDTVLARQWQLTRDEWVSYRTLMGGPRGIWSPNLDPVTVLGIHAETDAERTRYAELLVMLEYQRVEQELEFQRAYDAAAQKLFPTLAPIDTAPASAAIPPLLDLHDRVAWVGSVSTARCPECSASLRNIRTMFRAGSSPVLDLYLADAEDDDVLRAWAAAEGIPPAAVGDGRITLNHARAPFVPAGSEATVMPRLLQRRDGRWETWSPAE